MNLFQSGGKRISKAFSWFFNRSLIVKIIIIALLFGGIYVGYQKVFVKSDQTQTIQTAQVEKGTLVTNVTASGTVSSGNSVAITTTSTGIIKDVYVKNGDTVTAGETIADITLDQDSQQRQAAAWASYLSAQNNVNSAKSKMNSLQSALFKANQAFINDRGINNPSDSQKSDPKYIEENADWLQAESDYNNQQGVIAQANASFTSASLAYQQVSSTITAPAGGVINSLTVSPGTVFSTSTSQSSSNNSATFQSLGSININQGQIQASVSLSESDVIKVEAGQKVTVTLDAYPDKTFTGKVSAINTVGAVSSGVTTYPATIALDPTDVKMYPNMAVSAKIITNVKDNVLLIPTQAIQTQNGQKTVRVQKNGQIQSVDVTTGDANDTQTEITSGLSEGDTVVTSSPTQAATGQRATTSVFGGGLGRGGFGGGGGNAGRAVGGGGGR